MSFDRAGRPRMLAARSVAYSADGMSVDVKLRDDGFWSYGERVVAEDFARGLRRSALADSDSNHLMVGVRNSEKWAAGDYSAPLGIEALDADTLVIRLNAPFGYDLTNLMNMQANPYPPPGREGKPIASNGPYMIATMENERVTLARNPYYRRERPYFDRIEFIGFAHDVAVDYFISGKADVLIGPLGKQKKWLVERYKNNAIEIGLPRSYVLVLAAQTQNTPAPLKDAEFRRALFAALDHVAFENTDMFFKSNKHCGLIPAAIPCSDERKRIWRNDDTVEHRVQRALAVVERAGYGPKNPLKLSMVVATSIRGYPEIAGFVKSSWKEIGVDVGDQHRQLQRRDRGDENRKI
jgi:oligopeptide transport system substrate-binding protein